MPEPAGASLQERVRSAWQGRISGCMLGKPVEVLSMREGQASLSRYLESVGSRPLRDYVPLDDSVELVNRSRYCCRGFITRSEPDDDIHYSVLALMMLETFGRELQTVDVARTWLRYLPVSATFTAERAAYRILLEKGDEWFPEGSDPGFDLDDCANNPYNDWIGAQIRADVYGWVCPGNPDLAVQLVSEDARLSHRGDGLGGAVWVAAMGALIPVTGDLQEAARSALGFVASNSGAAEAVELGLSLVGNPAGDTVIRERYETLSPVHTVNNLALVVWSLLSNPDDFTAAIGDVVAAGLDTDCNGATVGGLWGLQGKAIPPNWTAPWRGVVGLNLAGHDELSLDELVGRTVKTAEKLG